MGNDAKKNFVSEQAATTIPIWRPVFGAGLACIAQYYVFAIIGIVRGHSVQSWWPIWILIGGVVILNCWIIQCVAHFGRHNVKKQIRWSLLGSYSLIIFSIVGLLQGRNHKLGKEFYEQKNYEAAIRMYEKEIDTWYLRLQYNYREDVSLFGMARSYCQLGDFEKARQTYQQLIQMAGGYYQGRGEDELAELDTELKRIAAYEDILSQTTDDSEKAGILFDLAFAYRDIECGQKAREQYALVQALDVGESRKEQAREFATDERW